LGVVDCTGWWMTEVGIGPLPFCEYVADELDDDSLGRFVMLSTCSLVGREAITWTGQENKKKKPHR
jgi:hypothetical protein